MNLYWFCKYNKSQMSAWNMKLSLGLKQRGEMQIGGHK